MPTTYRVVLETETRPREAEVALDHLPAIQVDAPNVDVAARLARVASHRQPADPASRRNLVRAHRDHAAALRPEGASPRPRRRGRDASPQRRVLAHLNRRALTTPCRRIKSPRHQANRINGRLTARLPTKTPQQLIDTRFPVQQFPPGPPRPAPASAGRHEDHRALTYVLQAPSADIRDTLLRQITHAFVGPGHPHDAVWQSAVPRIGCTATPCNTVTHNLTP